MTEVTLVVTAVIIVALHHAAHHHDHHERAHECRHVGNQWLQGTKRKPERADGDHQPDRDQTTDEHESSEAAQSRFD